MNYVTHFSGLRVGRSGHSGVSETKKHPNHTVPGGPRKPAQLRAGCAPSADHGLLGAGAPSHAQLPALATLRRCLLTVWAGRGANVETFKQE